MSKNKVTVQLAPPFSLLFLTFLVLKLTHVIAWSWWWVTVPLWGGLAIFLAVFAFILLAAALAGFVGVVIALFKD